MVKVGDGELWFNTTNYDNSDPAHGIMVDELDYNVTLTVDGIEVKLTDQQIETLELDKVIFSAVFDKRKRKGKS